jgi:predicted ATPase
VGEAIDTCMRVVQAAALGHGVPFFDTDIARNAARVMLIAGAPRSLGGNEDRMLATLRAVVESGLPLPVRIGTNAGHVFAGHFGPAFRRTYSVKGDAVNTAARIMAKAEPGTIYATASVLEPATALYETTALEPFAAKGKRNLLQAWSVGRRIGSKARELELPLVGRTAELRVFGEKVDDARVGCGGVLELVGAAGIGKTRLLAELTTQARGFQVLRALCEPYQQQIAYRPFRALLRAALDIPRGADNRAAAGRLRERVEELVPELLPWLPLLGVVMDVEVPSTTQVEELGEEFKRPKLEEVAAEFMSELLTEPTLIAIEDAHWIDEGSAGLLAGLAERIGKLPWVLAVTRRPETTGFVLVERDHCRSLLVQPLQPPEAESLVVAATEARPLRRHDIDALTERAAGNPLFLSQLLAGVLRTGAADDLPLTVESLVTEQVDRLPLRDRRILRFASVLGLAFPEELIWSVLEIDKHEPDPSAWTRLAEFLENTGPGRWRFRHALVREVAYEGLPFRRRRELHARAGLMILVAAGDPTEQAELLSHHFFAAQLYYDAWEYSVAAGKRARAKYANADAAAFLVRAIDAARRCKRVAAADLAEVHEHLGDVRLILNEYDSARAAYAAGRRLVRDDPITQARFLLQEAKTHCRGGRFADAIRSIRRGMRLLDDDRTPDARKVSARLAALYAGTRASQGRYREAETWCKHIIEASEQVGELEALARAYYILDFAYMEHGRVDEAVYSARSATLYEQLGDLSNQSEVISNSGVYAYQQGRWSEAIELYAQSLELRRRLGDDAEAAVCAANLAEVRLDQGRLEDAEHLLSGAARALHAGGYLPVEGFLAELLGRAAGQAGRLAEAMEHFASALAIFKRTGSRSHIFEIHVRIAEALVLAGHPEAALEEADIARGITSELGGIPTRLPLLHRVRAFAFLALGRADEARTALEKSIVAARERRAVHEVGLSLDALVRLDRRVGEEPDPALVEQSQSILEQLGVLRSDKLPA